MPVSDLNPAEMQVVELDRSTDETELALVADRYRAGDGDTSQERLDVVTADDGEPLWIDIAADRADPVDGEDARLARDVIGKRLDGDAS